MDENEKLITLFEEGMVDFTEEEFNAVKPQLEEKCEDMMFDYGVADYYNEITGLMFRVVI